MSRTLRAITAVLLVGIITFSAIIVTQNLGFILRADITEQNLYTLSEGTRKILKRIHQPINLKLYYTKTATRKARDEIRFYNQYFSFVKALLAEYERLSKGKIKVEIIDPRPYSKEEEAALRYALTRMPITQEENFFFGLVLQTEFGVVKTIPFFSPHRQNFVEYDISHLIDTAITREKKRIGILSSLPVMGEEGYMAQLRQMQGRGPRQPWTFVTQLKQQYKVKKIQEDVEEINDIDILLVIHPKDLSEKTHFAIDQFVLKGGRAIICVDPRCFVDNTRGPMGRQRGEPVSNLNTLLSSWGVKMPRDEFAGDRSLAIDARMDETSRAQKLIGYLNLSGDECFNRDNVITANLNEIRMLFGGVLQKTENKTENEIIPLLQTTGRGNSWSVEGPWDWVRIVPEKFMDYFEEGTEPVVIGCLVKGRFESSFPDGVEVELESDEDTSSEQQQGQTETKKLTGLKEAAEKCAVIVFSDVDFISDMVAYQNTIFGMKIPVANNSDILLNAIEHFTGSSELIGLRSRGNYTRPFDVVNKIRRQAEEKWAKREQKIRAEIERLENELSQLVSRYQQGEQELIGSSLLEKKNDLRVKLIQAKREMRNIKKERAEKIERLGNRLQNLNMWTAPAGILIIAILLAVRQCILRRKYVTHESDAG